MLNRVRFLVVFFAVFSATSLMKATSVTQASVSSGVITMYCTTSCSFNGQTASAIAGETDAVGSIQVLTQLSALSTPTGSANAQVNWDDKIYLNGASMPVTVSYVLSDNTNDAGVDSLSYSFGGHTGSCGTIGCYISSSFTATLGAGQVLDFNFVESDHALLSSDNAGVNLQLTFTNATGQVVPVNVAPEPSTCAFAGLALVGLALLGRKTALAKTR